MTGVDAEGGGGVEKMPDWDNLIVRCVANNLIRERMMGKLARSRQRSVSVRQPSGCRAGGGGVGVKKVQSERKQQAHLSSIFVTVKSEMQFKTSS